MKQNTQFMRLADLEIHPLAAALKNETNNFYQTLQAEFGALKIPTVTKDGKVLSFIEDFEIAKAQGQEEMWVNVVELSELDTIPLICYFRYMHKMPSYAGLHAAIVYLKEKLVENKGNKWYTELDGQDTDDKLEELLNESKTKIKDILFVEANRPGWLALADLPRGHEDRIAFRDMRTRIYTEDNQKPKKTKKTKPTTEANVVPLDANYRTRQFMHFCNNKLVKIDVRPDGIATMENELGEVVEIEYEMTFEIDYTTNRVGVITEKFFIDLDNIITLTRSIYELPKEDKNEQEN